MSMKYIVINDIAILATRNIEEIDDINGLKVTFEGVTDIEDNATLNLIFIGDTDIRDTDIRVTDERLTKTIHDKYTTIMPEELHEGIYHVTVCWTSHENNENVTHEACGCPFKVYKQKDWKRAIIPAPLSSATNIEHMWKGIINTLERVLPAIDSYQNGNDVI